MTVAQFPILIGECSISQAVAAIKGTPIPSNVEDSAVPTWYTPMMAVTQDNVNDFPGWRGIAPDNLLMPWWK